MVETGLPRAQFWASTLREISLDLEVAEARQTRDEQIRRWHTWHIGALPKAKKFPTFKDFVKPPAPAASPNQRRQDPVEQIAALKGILSKRQR